MRQSAQAKLLIGPLCYRPSYKINNVRGFSFPRGKEKYMKLKLSNGQSYDLVVDGVRGGDTTAKYIILPGLSSFEAVESDFCTEANVQTVCVLSDAGDTVRSIPGLTKYKGAEKIVDYPISDGETDTVMIISMTKPDIEDRVRALESNSSVGMTAVSFLADGFTDSQAIQVSSLYPSWSDLPDGTSLASGRRLNYNDKLYKVITTHVKQADYSPDVTPALFTVIDVTHSGSASDPIPYSTNMIVYSGKYYSYDNKLYLCLRDSGIALYHTPDQLLNNYFQEVTE